MNQHPIDGVARSLGAQDRRSSLKALALGFAAVGAAPLVASGKGKAGKKARKKCKKQVAPCNAAFEEVCADIMSAEECRAEVAECCRSLKSCNAGATMDCIVTTFFVPI